MFIENNIYHHDEFTWKGVEFRTNTKASFSFSSANRDADISDTPMHLISLETHQKPLASVPALIYAPLEDTRR